MSVSNFNKNKIVYIIKTEPTKSDNSSQSKKESRVWGINKYDGGFILDGESSALNLSFQFTHNYDNLAEKLLSKQDSAKGVKGMISFTKGMAEAIGGGKYIVQNTNVKTWKGTSPITLPESIKLKFYYGINDSYNCKFEVWDPILRLVNSLAPTAKGSFVDFQVPTLGEAMMQVLDQVFSTAKGTILGEIEGVQTTDDAAAIEAEKQSEAAEGGGSGTSELSDGFFGGKGKDAIEAVDKVLNGFYNQLNTGLQTIKDLSTLYTIRIGKITFNEIYIGSVKWSFDFSQVDSDGYPYRGTVELGGIEASQYTTSNYIKSIMPI